MLSGGKKVTPNGAYVELAVKSGQGAIDGWKSDEKWQLAPSTDDQAAFFPKSSCQSKQNH